jgi:hypothetical protein
LEEGGAESEGEGENSDGAAKEAKQRKTKKEKDTSISDKPSYKRPVPKMIKPLPGSRKIPKYIWKLKKYALPHKAMGTEWYAPGIVEQAYRKSGSVAEWTASKIRSKGGPGSHVAHVFEAQAHAQILDAFATGDHFLALELCARRLYAIRKYLKTGDVEWLEVLSFDDVDDDPVSPEERARRTKAVAARKKENADKRTSGSASASGQQSRSQSQSQPRSHSQSRSKPGANAQAKPFTPGKRGDTG